MLAKRVDFQVESPGDPGARIWERFPARKVALTPTPVGLQNSKYILGKWRDGDFGRTSAVGLQAVHDGAELALRLEWECEQPVASVDDNDQFADGAALLFPLSEASPLIMGAQGAPVNIWHWRADRPTVAHNNVADGIGTSRITRSTLITTRAAHASGRWTLVFRRELVAGPPDAELAAFEPGRTYRVALAVWCGANAERAGLKAFSPEWVELSLEA
ncbi:MAG TPA: ethylbenzene dehydrogenase-related protein [Steroidobacter sp.]|jgi:DMSO reductase family type II enzyme heme b subunit|nr:ethylbenzene dehydrogenase-related protein [Steroidobacteraceae bacterium]HLS82456.1 ethylbenzene dehydrogenase-related protein [Steroidobacter sp.]